MPLFDYKCTECNATFEFFVRNRESPVCPNCTSRKLEKLMSAPAGHVSGGGGTRDLPISQGCPPAGAPFCNPNCCRIPQ